MKPFLPSERVAPDPAQIQRRSLARAIVAMGLADGQGARSIVKQRWPNDNAAHDIVAKGAVSPTSTSSVTAFNQTVISDLVSLLGPTSASARIFASALGVSFDNSY